MKHSLPRLIVMILALAAPAFAEGLELPVEGLETRVDFGTGQGTEAFHSKLLAAKAAHDGAVDDGPPPLRRVDRAIRRITTPGQIADEPAGETIARSGGIEDII